MVSFVLFRLQMSCSISFANNLIEKYQTSADVAIINATTVFLDGGKDHPRPKKNGVGVKNRWESSTIPCGGTQ